MRSTQNRYNWKEIQKFYDQGKTWRDITEKFGVCHSAITKASRKGKFKSRTIAEAHKTSLKIRIRSCKNTDTLNYNKYNWNSIQVLYDSGKSWKDIQKEFGAGSGTIKLAVKKGLFKTRSHKEACKLAAKKRTGKKLSEEHKAKVSKSRIKFLKENPDKVPYLINHSSKKSYPEKLFENALVESKIEGWIYHFRNSIYEYDFAFPELKIDVEIDGSTHETEKIKKIDRRRDAWSNSQGWLVVRFTATEVKTDAIACIEKLKKVLSSR